MVFEHLFGAKDVEGHPFLMFSAGFLYTFISVPLALFFHPSAASILSVSLATIAAVPLIMKVIEFESDLLDLYPKSVLSREAKIIALYLWFFFGEIFGFVSAYLLAGNSFDIATSFQQADLEYVGKVRSAITGNATHRGIFNAILGNNIKVYIIGILLSFIYGTGGVFILTWNASVIATLITQKIIEEGSLLTGLTHFLAILPHGVIEYGAYIVGGFTGGLISLLLFQKGWSKQLIADIIFLLISGFVLLYIGAAVETTLILSS